MRCNGRSRGRGRGGIELILGAPAISLTTFAAQPTPQLLGAATAPAGTGMGVSPLSTPIAPIATPFDEENHQQIPRAEFRRAWDVYQTRERAVKRRYEADAMLDKGDLDGAAVWRRIVAAVNEMQRSSAMVDMSPSNWPRWQYRETYSGKSWA